MSGSWIVFGLGFGDCGKGTITDFLVRESGAGLVVRFNGGAQAGHNVVEPDGRHHTFSQFGSGTFVPGVLTHLGPAFVLHPGAMLVEAKRLGSAGVTDALERTAIDERALVVTPYQQAAGRLREIARGDARHGTCGVGVGETVSDVLAGHADVVRAADLLRPSVLRENLRSQRNRKLSDTGRTAPAKNDPRAAPEIALLDDGSSVKRVLEHWAPLIDRLRVLSADAGAELVRRQDAVVFEGAQGVLLDETWGFDPHTTWSDCTPAGAMAMLDEAGCSGSVKRLGVVRAYSTRHGEGPFPTWSAAHTAAHPDPRNPSGEWQGAFRTGPLDLVLLRYAAETAGGLDGVALTCLDQFGIDGEVCAGYRVFGGPADPDLCETGAGGVVKRLLPGGKADIGRRRRLGSLLRRAGPVPTRVSRGEIAETIAEAAGAPIAIESLGPAFCGKRWTRASTGRRPPLSR